MRVSFEEFDTRDTRTDKGRQKKEHLEECDKRMTWKNTLGRIIKYRTETVLS